VPSNRSSSDGKIALDLQSAVHIRAGETFAAAM
jgi:hypothetical protein